MRKRVTFVENLKNENLLKNRNGHSFMRSAEADRRCTGAPNHNGHLKVLDILRCTSRPWCEFAGMPTLGKIALAGLKDMLTVTQDPFRGLVERMSGTIIGCEYLPAQQMRESYRGTQINVRADSQHLKTIHPPTSVMSAAFLQRPTFIGGHRPYLYSIANIYSTEHMRRQMKQHYLDVLHACIQSGQNETRRRTCGDHHRREKRAFKTDPEKSAVTANKQQRRSSDRAYSDVTFPKIVNR